MSAFGLASAADYDPEIKEEAMFDYGKLQYEQGGGVFDGAIAVLNNYIESFPSSPRVGEARELLLAAYFNSRNYDAAYEAIKLVPDPDNNVKWPCRKSPISARWSISRRATTTGRSSCSTWPMRTGTRPSIPR